MPLGEARDELDKLKEVESSKHDLNERMDHEFALYRGDEKEYAIPNTEGEWEKIITNRAMVEGNRVMDDLSYAARKLWIPVADEDHRDRTALSATERTAIGMLYLADVMNEDSPYFSDFQSLLASYRVMRGWGAVRFLVREEDGKLIPDIAVWDPRNVNWIEGKKKLIWVSYTRYASKEMLLDEFPGWNGNSPSTLDGISENKNDLIPVHDVWDCSNPEKPAQEGVIIDREYVKEPEDAKVGDFLLNYIPVRIKAGKSLALISDDHSDNIKFVGQSYFTNNRHLYTLESRILSYQLTRASMLAKAPVVVEYDSGSGDPLPPEFDKDPYVKGRFIFLNKAKGQKLTEVLKPPSGTEIMEIYNSILGLEGIGGMNPVAFGRINTALPAQGIDILSHAALAIEMPFKKGVEDDIVWLAGEAVRQYKNGNFSEYEFEGYDKSNNSFYAKVKPKDINENWRFACELIPDLLRDKIAMLNAATTAVKSGLLSAQTARDQFQLVVDTDLEEQKVAKEKARAVFGIGEIEALMAYVEDYAKTKDPKTLFILNHAYKNLMQATMPQQPQAPAGGNIPAGGAAPGNRMTARRAQPTVPNEVMQAARRQQTQGL